MTDDAIFPAEEAVATDDDPPLVYPFASPPTIYDPSPELNDLREHRPVAPVLMPDGSTAWLVTRYDDVKRVLSDQAFSRAAAAGPNTAPKELGVLETESLIGLDPPKHTRMRRFVGRAFTPRRVEQLRPRVAAMVDELLDQVDRLPSPVDLVE
ncbi:MAG: hypothetical protein QOE61_664, partial [Micromonosporaceae bacterium]|nr:hypothetical protein [Micromonosporaceae bacterium]